MRLYRRAAQIHPAQHGRPDCRTCMENPHVGLTLEVVNHQGETEVWELEGGHDQHAGAHGSRSDLRLTPTDPTVLLEPIELDVCWICAPDVTVEPFECVEGWRRWSYGSARD